MGVNPSRFRVSLSGTLLDADRRLQPDHPVVQAFLGTLADALIEESDLTGTSVMYTKTNCEILLSGVVAAEGNARALEIAKVAFGRAISRAGGHSELPDETDPAWRLQHLLDQAQASVVPLAA